MRKTPAAAIALASLFSLSPASAGDQACERLTELRLPDVRIAKASLVEAAPKASIRAPHCKIAGVIGTEVHFELLLPGDWNGRFFMGGGGGYVGSVANSAVTTVNEGYATVGTDTGHSDNFLSAQWALDHAERQLNFGHLAIHRTAEVAKAVIRSYYGSHPERSYFLGCSRGGGQALMEAQRYPDDFDGIVSQAPAFDWTGFMTAMIQNVQLNYPDPENLGSAVITTANLDLLESRVLQTCDGLDGVEDGVMEDPRECSFGLETIASCPHDQPSASCLTTAQRRAIERIYAPAVDESGQIHPGWPFGGEGEPQGWKLWIGGPNGAFPNLHFAFATEFYKYFVYGDPDWDYSRYGFSTWRHDTHFVSTFLNATDPDLSRFKGRGGKLILAHGWSDPALSALRSVDYYEEVETLDPDVRDYFRMFLLPGVLHCAGGPGPDQVDWFSAIADWVERGRAPDRLTASKARDGEVVRSRPLCPYPQRAVYKGTGSTDEAASFSCQAP